jgi:cyclase
MKQVVLAAALMLLVGLWPGHAAAQQIPTDMKFKDVREIAPGVFFRYSAISATDPKVIFGGCNNIWIVLEDYVVVFDANFPEGAGEVIAEIKKRTNKPIRYVIDSHHHGDHAYGNDVFGKEGATIVAQARCADWLRERGPVEFADAAKPPQGRKDLRESVLRQPSLIFDDKFVIDDGKTRAEIMFFGHGHTPGDAFLYLPKQKILCTGDACVNGAFNFMGHADLASWIRILEKARQLDVQIVLPGHGLPSAPELLDKQRRYFVELRQQVAKGFESGKSVKEIEGSLDMPWYKEWTGTMPANENVQHAFDELTGRTMPWDLVEDFGIHEGPSPTKDSPGWKAPTKIVVPNLMPARLAELKAVAPKVFFVPVKSAEEAAKEAGEADAVVGFCTPEIVKQGKNLRWIQVGSTEMDKYAIPELMKSNIVLTNTSRVSGPNAADEAFGLLLSLTRGIGKGDLGKAKMDFEPKELHGKTMLIIGLGGAGTQIARRADAFGMRVMAVDPDASIKKPFYVFSVDPPAKLMELLPKADVVVMACPLTEQTKGMIGSPQFAAMKPTSYFINVARGGLVKTADLANALGQNRIGGAGLDVTDPEPLPADNPLWKQSKAIISPRSGGNSAGEMDRQWRLFRENIRRFVAGEKALCVVDKQRGY